MTLFINSASCQIVGFAVATIGWILGTTTMGFVEWRVWYLDNASQFSGLACVGMWRVCVFRHTNITTTTSCHDYTYHDTYLPLDIRVSQNLLLMASILGLLGKASVTVALKNVSMGIFENTTYKAFVISGILNIAAGICISVAVIWNYHSVMTEAGIVFPPSFNLPFKPHAQQIGNTVIVACLAASVLFLSGWLILSYKVPLDIQVHPEVPGM
uniref:Claudin-34 n=1 Tax=Moschus moschiferus TaxID=68415 RepID=A0A8C6DY65_MOSMO